MEGGGGDDSFHYQATDLVEDYNSASDIFIEKKVVPDAPSDDEEKDEIVNDDDLDKENEVLRGLLDVLGLKYNSVTRSCRTTKGMVICDMTCKVDNRTSFSAKLARPNRASAMLAATRNITGKLKMKFFPEKLDHELCGHKQTLVDFCKSVKRPEPQFYGWLEKGLYCARVRVGEEEAIAGGVFQLLAEAEGSASQLWIEMFGGPRPKQDGVFSSLAKHKEELTVARTDTANIKAACALLDSWSPRPIQKNVFQSKKKADLTEDLLDDSSLSAASQDYVEDDDMKVKTLSDRDERVECGTSSEVASQLCAEIVSQLLENVTKEDPFLFKDDETAIELPQLKYRPLKRKLPRSLTDDSRKKVKLDLIFDSIFPSKGLICFDFV